MKLTDLKGVGPVKHKLLNSLGIECTTDLLNYFPYDYEDKTRLIPLSQIQSGECGTFRLKIQKKLRSIWLRNKRTMVKIIATDGIDTCEIIFLNDIYSPKKLMHDKEYYFYGNPILEKEKYTLYNPQIISDDIRDLRICPKYRITKGITQKDMRSFVGQAMRTTQIVDFLPEELIQYRKLMNRKDAYSFIHNPEDYDSAVKARERFIYEEFFLLIASLKLIRNSKPNDSSGVISDRIDEVDRFLSKESFSLTNAQSTVLEEILKDMKSEKPMNRLLQGDVGSGKTVIAMAAAINACASGYQVAIIAPSEVVARQHYARYEQKLELMGFAAKLLIGGTPSEEKQRIKRELRNGKLNLVFGTHALIQDDVEFDRLGLVVADEQHRFGVKQRAALIEKGNYPDVLVMSATPIPRTLSLSVFGDLDISVINQLPDGRVPISTYAVNMSYQNRIFTFMEEQVKLGRQIYVVCPLIQESDNNPLLNSAESVFERIRSLDFFNGRVGLLHSNMRSKDKHDIISSFAMGGISVLVATTVVEVGVDVPNASVMVIYNAERFGLSQLHQLRGRVGRGNHESYCILVANSNCENVRKRLKLMTNTNDGFEIAEKDLEMRGAGELLGVNQHGLANLRLGDFIRDVDLIESASKDVDEIFQKDGLLLHLHNKALKDEILSSINEKVHVNRLN